MHLEDALAYEISNNPSIQSSYHHAQNRPQHQKECMKDKHKSLFTRFTTHQLLPPYKADEADLGKAILKTAANIFQNFLFTPSFSPGLSGGKSLRWEA